jgi:predicted enzyme related to lactoylglutathione lyase
MSPSSPPVRGAPCWVSLITRNVEAAQAFYGAVLGWDYRPGFHGQDNYCLALADGRPVAGIGSPTPSMELPVTWTAYFYVDSADQVADRIRERGATVAVGPLKFGTGRVAWAADPAGATFGIWEGEANPRWPLGEGVGAPARLELRARDAFASAIFYGEVFQWDTRDPRRCDVRYEHDRVVLRIGGRTVAALTGGAVEAAPEPQVRPRWHVYFRVADTDAAARRAEEAGGTITSPPADTPFGRVAMIRDPDGGLFTVASGVSED